MRKLSRDRMTQLAREILDSILRASSVRLLKERETVLQSSGHAVSEELDREIERERAVLVRIGTGRRSPKPGTPEYDELFGTLLEEEHVRDIAEG